jgi:hypothetical protein
MENESPITNGQAEPAAAAGAGPFVQDTTPPVSVNPTGEAGKEEAPPRKPEEGPTGQPQGDGAPRIDGAGARSAGATGTGGADGGHAPTADPPSEA